MVYLFVFLFYLICVLDEARLFWAYWDISNRNFQIDEPRKTSDPIPFFQAIFRFCRFSLLFISSNTD